MLTLDEDELPEIASVFPEVPDLLEDQQFAHLNREVLTALGGQSDPRNHSHEIVATFSGPTSSTERSWPTRASRARAERRPLPSTRNPDRRPMPTMPPAFRRPLDSS
jgi:hypothetical protein